MSTLKRSLFLVGATFQLNGVYRQLTIDLLVYAHRAAIWWSKEAQVDPDLFEAVYTVREGDVYFALNTSVNPAAKDKLQQGIDLLKSTKGESGASLYQEIMDKYE
ncbi:hypothetical protein ACN3E9_03760 [Vibrio pectenicida]|uniref:hypothetical protein n=1 Tax=Vibrio pectenicida TaxID=62763 RepID=UPI003B98E4E4